MAAQYDAPDETEIGCELRQWGRIKDAVDVQKSCGDPSPDSRNECPATILQEDCRIGARLPDQAWSQHSDDFRSVTGQQQRNGRADRDEYYADSRSNVPSSGFVTFRPMVSYDRNEEVRQRLIHQKLGAKAEDKVGYSEPVYGRTGAKSIREYYIHQHRCGRTQQSEGYEYRHSIQVCVQDR